MEEGSLTLRERRQQQTVLDVSRAAVKLFTERGFAETTVGDVVASAGVSPRTFHRYFTTKEDAISPMLEVGWRIYVDGFAERPSTEPMIDSLVTALAGSWNSDVSRLHRSVVVLITRSPELQPIWLRVHDRCSDGLREPLARRLGLDPESPTVALAARCVVAANRTAVEIWVAHPRRSFLDAARECLEAVSGVLTLPVEGPGRHKSGQMDRTSAKSKR